MDNWNKEEFKNKKWSGGNFEEELINYIDSLLSSQEQKHKKEMEELIGEWENFEGADNLRFVQSLKAKYLTKGKE